MDKENNLQTQSGIAKTVNPDQLYAFLNRVAGVLFPALSEQEVKIYDDSLIPSFVKDENPSFIILKGSIIENGHLVEVIPGLDQTLFNQKTSWLALLIKGQGQIVAEWPLEEQIFVSDFMLEADGYLNNLDKLRYFVSYVVSVYFNVISRLHEEKSFRSESENSRAIANKQLLTIRKKINELVLSLRQAQQTVHTPDLLIGVPSQIKKLASNADLNNVKPEFSRYDSLVQDSSFLNEIQSVATRWIQDIQDTVAASYDLENGTADMEIRFWAAKESSLRSIIQQLEEPTVKLTLEILKRGKRFHSGITYLSDSNIHDSLSIASKYNQLLKSLPIQELLSSSDLQKINHSVTKIFDYLQKLRVVKYPIPRAASLVQSIIKEIISTTSDVLKRVKLMSIPYLKFMNIYEHFTDICENLDIEIKDFTLMARELLRKRSDKFMMIRISDSSELQKRLGDIKDIRSNHHELVKAIRRLDGMDTFDGRSLSDRIPSIVELFETPALLDTSSPGQETFLESVQKYNTKVNKLEKDIAECLEVELRKHESSPENMLHIFWEFSFLLERPKVSNYLQNYREKLTNYLENQFYTLENELTRQDRFCSILNLRNIPEGSANIISTFELEDGLDQLSNDMEIVLSKHWEKYPEGKKIMSEMELIDSKFDTSSLFKSWCATITNDLADPVWRHSPLLIESENDYLKVQVNFDSDSLNVPRNMLFLRALTFDIPSIISKYANTVKRLHPYVISLQQAFLNYSNLLDTSDKLGSLGLLMIHKIPPIEKCITILINSTWQDFLKAEDLYSSSITQIKENEALHSLGQFANYILELRAEYEHLNKARHSLLKWMAKISICTYEVSTFAEILSNIQRTIDNITCNVPIGSTKMFFELLNRTIKESLSSRCIYQLQQYCIEMKSLVTIRRNIPILRHRLSFDGLKIECTPPLENSLMMLLQLLDEAISVVFDQMPIHHHSKFDVKKHSSKSLCYGDITPSVLECYKSSIRDMKLLMNRAMQFCNRWKEIQGLQHIEGDELILQCSSLQDWIDAFGDLYKIKALIDSGESEVQIGPFLIEFNSVQSKMMEKFNLLIKDLSPEFLNCLSVLNEKLNIQLLKSFNDIKTSSRKMDITDIKFLAEVQKSRKVLERSNITMKNISKANLYVQLFNIQISGSSILLEQLTDNFQSLRLLCDSIFNQLQLKRNRVLSKLNIVLNSFHGGLRKLKEDWPLLYDNIQKLSSSEAIHQLNDFGKQFDVIQELNENIKLASELMSVDFSSDVALQEISKGTVELRKAVEMCDDGYGQLTDLYSTPWNKFSSKALRSLLEKLSEHLNSIPSKFRTSYWHMKIQKLISEVLRSNTVFSMLSSEAMTKDYWDEIFEGLTMKPAPASMTLGNVLSLQPLKNRKFIRKVIQRAEYERKLVAATEKLESSWENIKFDVYDYKAGFKIVKGWTKLYSRLNDDLETLRAMKLSTSGEKIGRRLEHLEGRLSVVKKLLDIWSETQTSWIYLFEVFNVNQTIKKQIPSESTRFAAVSSDLRFKLSPFLESGNVEQAAKNPNVIPTLEKAAVALETIKKSLISYLEKERHLFPRFYFVGNDDLLEIVGNPTDILVACRYVGKMFPSICNLKYNASSMKITEIEGCYGETIKLSSPVSFKDASFARNWLTKLDDVIKLTLFKLVHLGLLDFVEVFENDLEIQNILEWLNKYPGQVTLIVLQLLWTSKVKEALENNKELEKLQVKYSSILDLLSQSVHGNISRVTRLKLENMIIEILHETSIIGDLLRSDANRSTEWMNQQKFYFSSESPQISRSLLIEQANSKFYYGFEYTGLVRRLVHTPLTNNIYLCVTEALNQFLGAALSGPAGTGKTETLKALGQNFGRVVLTFCCDETFETHSVGRILIGLSKLGWWGCFDEFNRLPEAMLSSLSTQIDKIEGALGHNGVESKSITLLNQNIKVNKNTGIFITGNPNYVGRTELPDNLKSKYRIFNVDRPDSLLIAECILLSQGFHNAKKLSSQVVKLFQIFGEKCSSQKHYDFGLRCLKSSLLQAGDIKRKLKISDRDLDEQKAVAEGLYNVILPRLIPNDQQIFKKCVDNFGFSYDIMERNASLASNIKNKAFEAHLTVSTLWVDKCLQLYKVWTSHRGVIMIGKTGSGKSSMLNCLISALKAEFEKGIIVYYINPKTLSKEELYGTMDYTTSDWKDGILTSILRADIDNLKGEQDKSIFVVFDGDIDPVWAENLNSVLDDNRLLTLPNGERLSLPDNLSFIFEVDNLSYATLATITRCGVVWFGQELFDAEAFYFTKIKKFQSENTHNEQNIDLKLAASGVSAYDIKELFISSLTKFMPIDTLKKILNQSSELKHVMSYSAERSIETFFTFYKKAYRQLLMFLEENPTFVSDDYSCVLKKLILLITIWAFGGDTVWAERTKLILFLLSLPEFRELKSSSTVLDLAHASISFEKLDWFELIAKADSLDLEPQSIVKPDTVVSTSDTVQFERLLTTLLEDHRCIILSGPPGAGKTMLLMSTLRQSPNFDFAGMNFSEVTSPKLVLQILEQYCVYTENSGGLTLHPLNADKWVVIFCDEINLPKLDSYGSQPVIEFLRQLVSYNGFWSPTKVSWVTLSHIQFVGACNPPSDAGRTPLSERFLRVCSILMIDYPSKASLKQIYLTFNKSLLKLVPDLSGYSGEITNCMLEVYEHFCEKFNVRTKIHYICSPRELTRWVRGIYQSIQGASDLSINSFIRLWTYEALRIFSDKLESEQDQNWVLDMIKKVVTKNIPLVDCYKAFSMPILYSDWLSYGYGPVNETEMADFVRERLKVFSVEESQTSVILHPGMINHILEVDRVLRNSQGHLILVGPSGSGKNTITHFVAWMNGIKVVNLYVSHNYTLNDFDNTLKDILIHAGIKGEKVCFIVDESTILESSFLERMNTLLANAEIPGLFTKDELDRLLKEATKSSQAEGLYLSSSKELYGWFTEHVAKNLHVVFTISDPYQENGPHLITSPALFNRCVLIWMGDWKRPSLKTIARNYLAGLPIDNDCHKELEDAKDSQSSRSTAVVNFLISAFLSIPNAVPKSMLLPSSPLQFISFIENFKKIFVKKESETMAYHRHIQVGLDRLKESLAKIKILQKDLEVKKIELSKKDAEAQRTLDQILSEQNEAERKEEASLEIQKLLQSQTKIIKSRQESVYRQLAEVEPLVEEAQKGVKNIKKEHLTEMRSMNHPPDAVKLTLESVCTFLGFDVKTWRDVQNVVRKEDFIARIIEYNGEKQYSKELTTFMDEKYMKNPIYNYETVNRASKACGPLFMWLQAQLRYSAILDKLEPLRQQMAAVKNNSVENKTKLIAINGMLQDLHSNIHSSKKQYTQLIRDTEGIKLEMTKVQKKVNHSSKLLQDLSDEQVRWQSSVREFESNRQCLIGNALLSASFMSFAIAYDESVRSKLVHIWKEQLGEQHVSFNKLWNFTTNISDPKESLKWESLGLPKDNLFKQNVATLTSKINKNYFLIVDPSGFILKFLCAYQKPKELIISSFLDNGYIRQVENCVRFGGSIAITDADKYDPVMNTVIAHNTFTNGGRTLVTICGHQIDLSPDFQLYLYTRNPSICISPFLASRMCVVNFTFTTMSLRSHGLNMCLQFERPDLEQRRTEVMRADGILKQKLIGLETELLEVLNSSGSDMLEDTTLLKKLEEIKKESNTIKKELAESETLMDDLVTAGASYDKVAGLYCTFSLICKALENLNPIYVFPDNYVTRILKCVLQEYTKAPVDTLESEFAKYFYVKTGVSLLPQDRTLLGILCYISAELVSENDFDLKQCIDSASQVQLLGLLNPYFDLQNKGFTKPVINLEEFSSAVKDNRFLVLRSSENFDTSKTVKAFAASEGVSVETFSVGSRESMETVTRLLKDCNATGQWLLIENIQFSAGLVEHLPKLLSVLSNSNGCRVFMTTLIDSKLENAIYKMSKQYIFTTSPGIKGILVHELLRENGTLSLLNSEQDHTSIISRFLLAWVYATLKEYTRFAVLKFHKRYDFSEYDLEFGWRFISQVLMNDEHDLDSIRWNYISRFIGRVVFGGKVDIPNDLELICTLCDSIFCPEVVKGQKSLLPNTDENLFCPGGELEAVTRFINNLPVIEPIKWLSLPEDSEDVLKNQNLTKIMGKCQSIVKTIDAQLHQRS